MCSLTFYFHPIIHKVISNRSSPPARRAPGAILVSKKCSVQSSVHPPPQKSGFRASALSFTSLSSIIGDVQWTQSSNGTGKLVASCAHLDNVHPPILPWKYFFYSSQLEAIVHVVHFGLPPALHRQPSGCLSFPFISSECSASLRTPLPRFQNIFTRFWINLHRFLGLNASSPVT